MLRFDKYAPEHTLRVALRISGGETYIFKDSTLEAALNAAAAAAASSSSSSSMGAGATGAPPRGTGSSLRGGMRGGVRSGFGASARAGAMSSSSSSTTAAAIAKPVARPEPRLVIGFTPIGTGAASKPASVTHAAAPTAGEGVEGACAESVPLGEQKPAT